jgi:GTP:adenosylcobinamide-phosphate guanylyltransferase
MSKQMLGAIVLAGETPGKIDPLAAAAGVAKKSLVPIAGRPMVSYVYDALDAVERVECVVIVGLTEADGLTSSKKAIYHQGFGDFLDNVLGSIQLIRERRPDLTHIVIVASDAPMVTTNMVNTFVDACLTSRHELYYSVVEQSVMERTYPESGRSFRRFGEHAYAGGDMHMVSTDINVGNIELVRQATQSRKSGLGLARLLGIRTLVKFALGRLTMDETVETVQRVFGLHGRAIVTPDAALAMDVDKPHQLEQVRAILDAQNR